MIIFIMTYLCVDDNTHHENGINTACYNVFKRDKADEIQYPLLSNKR